MMETGNIAKQMIGYQKTVFENSFKAMVMVQDQTENLTSNFLDQIPGIPDEGKQAIKKAMDFTKDSRNTYKKSMDDWYSKIEDMFNAK